MPSFFRFPLSSLVCTLGASTLLTAADLSWEATTLELRASNHLADLVYTFPFRNTGSEPVEIKSVQPDCSCVTAHVSRFGIASGESGRITGRFAIEGRHGKHTHKIIVTYTDPRCKPSVLTLVARLPEAYRIEPAVVTWDAKNPQDHTRRIVVIPAEGRPIDVVKLAVSTPELAIASAPGDNGQVLVNITRSPRFDGRLASIFITVRGLQTALATSEIFVSSE